MSPLQKVGLGYINLGEEVYKWHSFNILINSISKDTIRKRHKIANLLSKE